MLHLVVQMVELQVGHVHQSTVRCADHVRFDGGHRVVVHLARLRVRLAGLDPRLEQVLVEAVTEGAQRHVHCVRIESTTISVRLNNVHNRALLTLSPHARLRVQIVRIQALRLLKVVEDLAHILHTLTVHRIACDVAQIRKLQMQRSKLGQNAAAAARPAVVLAGAGAQIDDGIRYAGRRLEGGH